MTTEPETEPLQCSTCTDPKTEGDFYHRQNGARFRQCKQCMAARNRRYHQSDAGKDALRDSQKRKRIKQGGGDSTVIPKKRETAPQTVAIRQGENHRPRLFFSPFAWEQLGKPEMVAIWRDGPTRVSIRPGATFRVTIPPGGGQPRLTLGESTLRSLGLEVTNYPATVVNDRLVITTPEVHVAFEVFIRTAGKAVQDDPTPRLSIRASSGALGLNYAAFETLGKPVDVELLWDAEHRYIGLRSAPAQTYTTYKISRSVKQDRDGGSVQLKQFALKYDLDMKKIAGRYDAVWADPILYIAIP